jgi:hypothetical protein
MNIWEVLKIQQEVTVRLAHTRRLVASSFSLDTFAFQSFRLVEC